MRFWKSTDSQRQRPRDAPSFCRITPNLRKGNGERFERVAAICFHVAIRRGPSAEVAEKLIESPTGLHAKGRRRELRKREGDCAIAFFEELALGRPIRANDVGIIVLHETVCIVAFDH